MQSGPADARRLRNLGIAECYRKLRAHQVGRLAIADAEGVLVIPVNYAVDGDDIVIRTSPYGLIGLSTPQAAAFEIDDLDAEQRLGWSVLVRGMLAAVDPDEAARLRQENPVEPWAGGNKSMTVRLRPHTVTGRAL